MAPKNYSQNMAYNRRIGRLLYILIGVMLLVALLAGFIGAYVRLGGIKHRATPQPRISRRLAKTVTTGEGFNLAELEEHIEKPDLFVALRLAKEHLDKQKSSDPSIAGQGRDDKVGKSGIVPLEFQDLCFILTVDRVIDEPAMNYLRSFVGGLHRLRSETHQVPQIFLFLTKALPMEYREEISMWTRVELANLQSYLALPLLDEDQPNAGYTAEQKDTLKYVLIDRIAKEHDHAILVKDGYEFDPAHQSLRNAEKTEDPELIKPAIALGQKYVMGMVKSMESRGYVNVVDGKTNELLVEGYLATSPLYPKMVTSKLAKFYGTPHQPSTTDGDVPVKTFGPAECGIYKHNPKSDLACNLDIKPDPVINILLTKEVAVGRVNKKFAKLSAAPPSAGIKKLAMAMPTTSKGMKNGTEPVFFHSIIPSLIETILPEEVDRFLITVYIGFDHGDEYFEDEQALKGMISKIDSMIGEDLAIQVKFIRFPRTGRVAMLWSMLFMRAMREDHQYFYQVNDDLTLVTKGWLTKFTGTLDGNGGFGVVGPADFHNKLNCTVLTQAMVTRTHYDIFTILYPLELKDWKTDRWLTHVYGPENTFCWNDWIANNGASKTRYAHCPFLSWRIFVEAGKSRIKAWQQEQASITNKPAVQS